MARSMDIMYLFLDVQQRVDTRDLFTTREGNNMKKTYTAQVNSHSNIIVCGDEIERNSYTIFYKGSYADCLALKSDEKLTQNDIAFLKSKVY